MLWSGKLIGSIFGFLLGGPIGAVLGFMIGHTFDKGYRHQQANYGHHSANQAKIQQAFFKTTFLVMGHIAKADGRVSEDEIRAARSIMSHMRLDEEAKQEAIRLFNLGKQPDFNLEQTLTEFLQVGRYHKSLLQMFIEIQVQAANADGRLSPQKHQLLHWICQRLGVIPVSFIFSDDAGFGHQQGNHYKSSYARPTRNKLQEAYHILGIKESATNAEVKYAYRRLMSQHHPDKLVAKGLPEEMLKLATEKTQQIKAAYEQICAARGM